MVKDFALKSGAMRPGASATREVHDDLEKLKTKELGQILEDSEK